MLAYCAPMPDDRTTRRIPVAGTALAVLAAALLSWAALAYVAPSPAAALATLVGGADLATAALQPGWMIFALICGVLLFGLAAEDLKAARRRPGDSYDRKGRLLLDSPARRGSPRGVGPQAEACRNEEGRAWECTP